MISLDKTTFHKRRGEIMSEVVAYTREGNVGVISVNYPPVNALSHAVRAGLVSALEQGQKDAEADILLLVCEGRTFIAGADIREFGKPLQEPGQIGRASCRERGESSGVAGT